MSYQQQGKDKRPQLRLDQYRIVFGFHKPSGGPMIWWEPGMCSADARVLLRHLYEQLDSYLEEVTQPPPPRDKPSPHYRDRRTPLPTRIEE